MGIQQTEGKKNARLTQPLQPRFFLFCLFFNQYSRNKSGQNFFQDLALFSCARLSWATYEGVTSYALT
jgi:hypothetical protein